MSADLVRQAAAALEALRADNPLVHCIANHVTAPDTANMLLAAGASPIMADDPAECAEVTAHAQALSLNLGTPSPAKLKAMLLSAEEAAARGIPVVLDPVGAGLTRLRREFCAELRGVSAVRGNLSETAFLAGLGGGERGVDSLSAADPAEAARMAAQRLGCVCAVTGAADFISDGTRTVSIRGGSPLMRRITGAGCMTSALCAAFSVECGAFVGALAGAAFMKVCAEIAGERSDARLGSFHTALFDAAGSLTARELAQRAKITPLNAQD